MTSNLGNLSGRAHKVPCPPAPLPPSVPPTPPPFKPTIGPLANRVQSAATPITPTPKTPEAKSTTSEVISARKPPLPPRGFKPEIKDTLDRMKQSAKEGTKGQGVSEVRASIETNRHNIKWLTDSKKWAQTEIEKLNASQKLLEHDPNAENYTEVNKLIQDTVKERFSLLQDIEKTIILDRTISPKSDDRSPKSDDGLISSINKFMENLFPTKVPTNEQTIKSMAGNRLLNPLGFEFLEKITSLELKDLFENFLKAEKETGQSSAEGRVLADCIEKTPTAKEFIDRWVNDLKTVRENQLSRLEKGENALPLYEIASTSLAERWQSLNRFLFTAMDEGIITNNERVVLEPFFRDVTECAILINSQILSDDFYPPGVREKAKLSATDTRAEDVAKANQEKGITDGFSQRTMSNVQNKSNWEMLEFKNDIFESGYRKIAVRTPNGPPVELGALLDLTPLHNITGRLNEKQVIEVFRLIQEALSRHFNLLGENPDMLKKRITNEEVPGFTLPQMSSINEMNDMLKDKEKLGMNDEQLAMLRTIVIDFCNKLSNATTLALLSVGHQKENQ